MPENTETPREFESSELEELHAASAHIAVGLLGTQARCEEFIQLWCNEASKVAMMIQEDLFPDIQLIPMQETEEPESDASIH